MPATAHNRLGYFEDLDVCDLNDRWLASLGGSWWAPPKVHPAAWGMLPIDVLNSEREFLSSIGVHGPSWFVKDPRISLLLPLWDRLALAVTPTVLCVRNPLDVALSLRLRGGMAESRALALWWAYMQAVLETSADRQVLVIDFDAMVRDPEQAANAVCTFASTACSVPEASAQRTAGLIVASEQRCHGAAPHGISSEQEKDVYDLYQSLAACHGGLLQVPPGIAERPEWIGREIKKARRRWRATAIIRTHESERSARALQDRLLAADRVIADEGVRMQELQHRLTSLEQSQVQMHGQIQAMDESHGSLGALLRQREQELAALRESEMGLIGRLTEREEELAALRESEKGLIGRLTEREQELAALRESEASLVNQIEAAIAAQETFQASQAVFTARLSAGDRRQEALEGAVRTFLAEAQRSERRLSEIVGSRSYRISRRVAAPFRVLAGRGQR